MTHLVFLPAPEPRMFLFGVTARSAEDASPTTLAEVLAQIGDAERATVVGADARRATHDGVAIPVVDALIAFAAAGDADLARAPASVVAWALAAKMALELVVRERIVPTARSAVGHTSGASVSEARWAVSLALPDDAARAAALAAAMPPAAHRVPIDATPAPPVRGARRGRSDDSVCAVWAADALLRAFLDAAADGLVRTAASSATSAPRAKLRDTARRDAPAPWERQIVSALTTADPSIPTGDFRARGLGDGLAAWSAPAVGGAAGGPLVGVRFDLPAPDDDDEQVVAGPRRRDSFRLAYFVRAADDASLHLPAEQVWTGAATAAMRRARAFRNADEHLLRGLAVAARICPAVDWSLRDAQPVGAALTADEAWKFLADEAPALAEAGIVVVVPADLTRTGRRRLRLRMRVATPGTGTAGVVEKEGGFGLAEIADFQWEAAVGETALTAEELDALARLKAPLVRLRGQWVAVDRSELAEMQRLIASGGGRLSRVEAVAAALAGVARGPSGAVDVVAEGGLSEAIARLRTAATDDAAGDIPGFHGELRPYQRRGVAWLTALSHLGFGACLADDMGLGKTIQVLAFLLSCRHDRPADGRPTLLVCPTSVVGNWEREAARFAPSLPVVRHHGGARTGSADDLAALPAGAVVLTTYGVLRRDASILSGAEWASVVLDEAQNVKNAASRTARAARSLRASHRIALTGTPVENRLAELWSVVEFGNPGLLGPLETFRRETAAPIERWRDEAAAARLRSVVGPFLLRRVKSDPAVISDLPAKNEMKVFCSLTPEQATLYKAAVDDALERIAEAEGVARRGRVLALLTALKQICNHPAQYLGESGPLPGRSGKLARLTEMLEESVAEGDRALVFTQYREMGDRIVAHVGRALGVECPFLHGGVGRAARDELVRAFQEGAGPGVFVLSLKAGGTGLNLTRATRVFHFDRWWNPAVEDQATDRAYRIGQTRAVQVHKFVTAGTIEEKVDAMLEEKRDLASRIVATGERWITEMDDAALRDVFALTAAAVVSDAADAPEAEEAVR